MKKLLTGLILIPVALIGCSGQKPEKERFANATKEITCLVLKSNDLLDPTLEQKSKDIFKNYGFNPDDQKQMQTLVDTYQKDTDVKAAVAAAAKECGGPDLAAKLKGINGSAAPATTPTEEKTEPKTEAKTEAKTDSTVKAPATPVTTPKK